MRPYLYIWRAYAEPFPEFVHAARLLGIAVAAVSEGRPRKVASWWSDDIDRKEGVEILNALSAGVSPVATVSAGNRIQPEWRAPSLLGQLAMQAVQDIVGARRIRTCPCGITFTASGNRAKHHDSRCGAKYRKRAERKNRKKVSNRGGTGRRRRLRS